MDAEWRMLRVDKLEVSDSDVIENQAPACLDFKTVL